MPGTTDLEDLKQARPYIRSVVALALYLRFGGSFAGKPTPTVDDCYRAADLFVDQLEADVAAAK